MAFDGRRLHIVGIGVPILYLVVSFLIVQDYGITWDEPGDFGVGHKYLHFYRTLHLDFRDDMPHIENHPDFYDQSVRQRPWIYWPFANTLSAVTCTVFFQELKLLNPVAAHHIVIPILVSALMWVLYRFVARHWGPLQGVFSILVLITYPRFFGHSFNNIKDVPEIVLFSITVILFAEWVATRKVRYLVLSFVCWACAFATKVDAVTIPLILLLWQAPALYRLVASDGVVRVRTILWLIGGLIIAGTLWLMLYPPLLQPQPDGRLNFLAGQIQRIVRFGLHQSSGWNMQSEMRILHMSPILMLASFLIGIVHVVKERRNTLNVLLLVWVCVPVLRQNLPGVANHDGLRLFLSFIVPWSVIAARGLLQAGEFAVRKAVMLGLDRRWAFAGVAVCAFAPNVYAIASTHPYQTTYYNSFVGGLGGAQKLGLPYSCDYWLNSYREAGEWLDEHGAYGAHYVSQPHPFLLSYSLHRTDFVCLSPEEAFGEVPPNTYFVIVPRVWPKLREFLDKVRDEKMPLVFRVERQGGEIISIYYKPPPTVTHESR